MVPGRVEQWILIIDLNNTNLTQIPLSKTKSFLTAASTFFAGRAFKTYVVNAKWSIRAVFACVVAVMDDFARAKIEVCSDLTTTLHI
jgi:hypothetical protein